MRNTYILLLTLAVQISFNALCFAQDPAPAKPNSKALDVMGNIDIEEETKAQSPFSTTQNNMIEYFTALADKAEKGELSAPFAELDDPSIQYLTAVYLYCSINRGTCPMVLDAIFETDFVNSVNSDKASCPNMSKFWKSWAKNSMEERHNYMVKTGYMATTQTFKQTTRPKYIRCAQTIQGEMDKLGGKESLAKRYASGTLHDNIKLMPKLLTELKDKGVNVFVATGYMKEPAQTASRSE